MKISSKYAILFALLFLTNIQMADAMPTDGLRHCVSSLLKLVKNPFGRIPTMNQKDDTHLDLTLFLRPGMLRFPGDPDPTFTTKQISFGDELKITMSEIQMGVHLGTHVDAPAHFIQGARTVDRIPVQLFVGEVQIVDLSGVDRVISRADLEGRSISNGTKLFIKTRNSKSLSSTDYQLDHVYIARGAAEYLVEKGIKVLGFDYYNIDSSKVESLDSHLTLAKADIPVIVAINMTDLNEGKYHFSAVPLSLTDLEASPVRVVVWK